MINSPSEFGLDPICISASKAGVSSYTFVRLAKTMGFDEFRDPFRHALLSTGAVDEGDWLNYRRSEGDFGRIYANAAQNALSITRRSLEPPMLIPI
ncbi:MAG: hypothetical protein ACPGGK_15625 [Pikeienuella sp.]